jgi:hypothetical protein
MSSSWCQVRGNTFTVVARILSVVMAALVFTLLTGCGHGSGSENGQTFVLEGGDWFLELDGHRFKVDPDVVSVKFRADVTTAERMRLYAEQETEVVRENQLGIIDLRVPTGKSPIEFVRDLEATGLFEFAEVNTFGRYIESPSECSSPKDGY